MRVLITNIEMITRTGSVTVVRDVANNLRLHDHHVMVYAPVVGDVGRGLRRDGISVFDDIEKVDVVPDVIHGHHSLPTVAALARFPGCPCVWWSHGRNDWFDVPPRFERIRRYLAIDIARQRMLAQHLGRALSDIGLLHNGVDPARIPARPRPLPEAPKRALLFAKWLTAPHAATLQAACRGLDIEFHAVGNSVGRVTDEPERWLVESDVVFATGRSALEALCCGAAVVVGDYRGMAGMVTTANFNAQRNVNFGTDGLIAALTVPNIEKAIRQYNAADASAVAAGARDAADFSKVIDRLEATYREAIATQPVSGWTTNDAEALDAYVTEWPVQPDRSPPGADWNQMRGMLQRLAARNAATSST